MVTVLFNNGSRTFSSNGDQDYRYESLIRNLEKVTVETFDLRNGYDFLNLNKVVNIARNLASNNQEVLTFNTCTN